MGIEILNIPKIDTIQLPERTSPSTPPSGSRYLYAKSDGIYEMASTGTETNLNNGGAGGSFANTDLKKYWGI